METIRPSRRRWPSILLIVAGLVLPAATLLTILGRQRVGAPAYLDVLGSEEVLEIHPDFVVQLPVDASSIETNYYWDGGTGAVGFVDAAGTTHVMCENHMMSGTGQGDIHINTPHPTKGGVSLGKDPLARRLFYSVLHHEPQEEDAHFLRLQDLLYPRRYRFWLAWLGVR